jgi:hypothetical protein
MATTKREPPKKADLIDISAKFAEVPAQKMRAEKEVRALGICPT